MGGGQGSRIVRTWVDLRAPTGEGTHYETEDGTIWRNAPVAFVATVLTGEAPGYRVGDRMFRR